MSEFLASLNIPVSQPFSDANLQPHPDLVIVGNAISRGNPELEYVLDRKILLQSMPQVLHDEFLAHQERLVVAARTARPRHRQCWRGCFTMPGDPPVS